MKSIAKSNGIKGKGFEVIKMNADIDKTKKIQTLKKVRTSIKVEISAVRVEKNRMN
jgi:hypothetical protein